MTHTLESLLQRINQEIDRITFPSSPNELYEPVQYALSLGGKRIRPVLALMACNLYNQSVGEAIAPALGLEIFHNFTLLHDDLMDKADIRRGQTTVHQKWSANTAILSGDAMQILAYQYIAKCPVKNLATVLDLFSQTALEVCEGQQYDMDFEKRLDVTDSEYLEMIRLKTAVLLACALKMGAIIGGAGNEDSDLLYQFGIKIGLAFQLKDDLLDTFGDQKKFGKTIGGDIFCNKKTYLLIKTLELATVEERSVICDWLEKTNFVKEEKVDAIRAFYLKTGAKKLCEELAEVYYNEALSALAELKIDSEKTRALRSVAEMLMFRES